MWQKLTWFAIGLYCFFALALIAQRPGLQYDEALLVLGSVHMRHSPQELSLPHDPDTWVSLFGHSFPLMTVRYVGAIKEYLCLPVFAIFGPRTAAIRIVSALLGVLGIFGISRLISRWLGSRAAAVASLLLAVNPAYVDMTVFDNGTVAVFMGALGLGCIALSRFLALRSVGSAFWFGVTLGIGVWARANFLWFAGAGFAAAFIVLKRQAFLPIRQWAAIALGSVMGAFPFLAYQVHSKGGTWEAMEIFSTRQSLSELLLPRLVMFSETLLSDREHRAMWDGPPMADWQRWIFPAFVLVAFLVCWAIRAKHRSSARARTVSLTFLLLAAVLFTSRMIIAEHHLIVLVPLAAVVVSIACVEISDFSRWSGIVLAILALIYGGSALQWQIATVRGLRASGGVGPWSDAVFELAASLERKYASREVKVLDWGLQNNLYVVSDGRIHSQEIFPDATQEQSGRRLPWADEVKNGGIFVLNGPANRQIPAASNGFLRALGEVNVQAQRFPVRQCNGLVYAEIIEVVSDGSRRAESKSVVSGQLVSTVTMRDSRFASRLEGFHQIEQTGWRWTKREFAIDFEFAEPAEHTGALLVLETYLPDPMIQSLGTITLTASMAGHQLAPEKIDRPGSHTFYRELQADWIGQGSNRARFVLDKCRPPTAADPRELGLIVSSASVELR